MGTADPLTIKTISDCLRLNEEGWDMYFIPNVVSSSFVGVKPKDSDIIVYNRFVIDFDPVEAVPDLRGLVRQLGNIPWAGGIVWTGNGVQLHLHMDYCYVEAGEIRRTCRRVGKYLAFVQSDLSFPQDFGYRIDTCTSDASRMVRMPYTINWKTGVRGDVRAVANEGARFHTEWLPESADVPISGVPFNCDLTNLSTVAPRLTRRAAKYLLEGEDGPRHQGAYAAAKCLQSLGVSFDDALKWVQAGVALCVRPADSSFNLKEAEHCVRTAYKNQV